MQYKGFKRIRRAAAVILSAALIITELPQTEITYAAEADGYETQTDAEQDDTSQTQQEGSASDSSAPQTIESGSSGMEDSAVENSVPESGTESGAETACEPETGTAAEAETSDITGTGSIPESSEADSFSTETPEAETSETAGSESESESEDDTAETAGAEESTDLESTESEMIVLEEMETEETETTDGTSVPVPHVDASVYSLKTTKNLSSFRIAAPRVYASVQDPVEITANEYRIENRDQFFGFLSGKSDYDGCTVTLACSIDMKSETAYFGGRFAGTFDGNGYSIRNLKVDQGLFPVIQSGAVVKNLHISNASMTGEYSAGIIAGRNDGTITNCVVTGNLEASNKMEYTAGIAGVNEGNIENCVFAGNITAAANTADAEKDIGGIAGRNNGVIRRCYAVGSMNTKAAVVAGIAGTNTSRQSESIKDCANYMSVEGASIAAGIVGVNESEVVDCTNYGAVRQKNNSQEIGEAGGIAAQNKIGTIRDCYNYATINGEDKNIGGIAATTSGTITRCGNYGSVTGLANVGGIVGLYNGSREYSISECFNQGNVNGSGKTSKAMGIGGILGSTGESYRVPIENCYNTGNIRATNDTQYLGGIAGIIYKGSISNCYNAGNVVGEESSYAAMLVGFFGREEDTSCANCLYVGDERKIAFFREEGGVSDTEMAKTASDLKSQDALSVLGASFSSDDGSSMNNGYPILNGQTEPIYRYPVVYELNGGYSGSIYYELIDQDGSVNKPEDPTKNYAAFQGWYTDAGFNVSYNFGSPIKAPVILYAKWKNDTVVEDIDLYQTSLEMMIGEEYTIKVRYTPEKPQNAEMVWDSSDTSVVTVDEKGTIRAAAAGRATITGKLKDNSLSKALELKVTVTDKDNIIHIRRVDDGVELSELDIAVKETVTLEAVTYGFSNNATIQWGPGKDDYVKVTPKTDSLGTPKAVVEGIKPTPSGSPVKVKFTVMDGDTISSQSVNITVLPLATGVKVKLDEEDVTEKTVIYDLVTKKFIAVGTKKLKKPVEALSAAISPSNASQKVTWSSNNSSVVKFDDKESGVVTGNISGTAEVTALTKDGSNKSGKTTIRTKRIVQSFVLEPKEENTPVVLDSQGRVLLTSGCSVRLVPKFTPADVTDEGLKWEMNPKNCLDIDAEKKIVTAKDVKSQTKVTVKATSLDGGEASYEMEFVIIPKVESIEIYDTKDMKSPVNGKTIGVNPETDSKTFTLRVKNKPDDASQVVLWKSASTKVAAVSDHEDGSCTVTVNGYGKTDIIATAADGSGVTASVAVNVSSLVSAITITGSNKVAKGGKIKLKAEVFPKSAENKAVIWETDDKSIATVDKNTGEVTGINKGLADITATAADGGGASQTFHILVTEAVKTFDLMIPDGNTDPEDDVIVTNKVVGIDLDAGMENYTLAPRILPEEASHVVEWKSSNEKIATVDEKGTITAKSLGRAIITAATTDGSNKTAKTTVNVATLVRNISITGSHYVSAGQSIQLHAEVTDKDAANKSVIWTSSDKNAVVVDDSGLVTAISRTGEAMAKITAEAADGSGKYAEHIIYVMGKSDKIQITEFDGRFVDSGKKSSEIDIQDIKNSARRVAFVAALDGGSVQQGDYRKEVEWKTSNKSIAEIYSVQNNYGGSEAVVRILKEGTVTITARTTDGSNREDSYTLKVIDTDPDVTIVGPRQVANGKKIQLSTEGSVAVTWSSSDPSLATVDAKGKVTAKKNVSGTVTIRATSTKGTQKIGDYYVEVCPAVTSVDILVNGKSVKGKKIGMDLIKGYIMDGEKTWNNKLTLYSSVEGANYDDRVTWKSNKTAVASVDENGNVEVKKSGTAVITATATDGSGKTAKVTLLVTKQITKIEPENGDQDIYVGYKKSVQLKLAYKPLAATTKKVTWESDDKSLVSVTSSGKITVKKPFGSGDYDTSSDNSVIIRARAADGSTAFCEFRVHFVAPATKVQIVRCEDNIDKEYASVVGIDIDTNDAKIKLKANVTSTNSYAGQYGVGRKVTWKSSNESIAEVEPNDDGSCTVTGHSNGKVTITATAADGSKKSGKVTVYVGKLIQSIDTTKDIQGLKDNEGREIITLYVKSIQNRKTLQLSDKLIVNPITATNKKLTYKSSNSKLVSVSSSGKLTAKKRGTADVIITITTNDGSGVTKEIVVRVLQ